MTKFLKNIKKFLPVAFLATIILILASLTGLNSNTVSGAPPKIALICDTAACNTETDKNHDDIMEQVDVPLREHLETLGTVTTFDDGIDLPGPDCNEEQFDTSVFDVVVISDSADSCRTWWLKNEDVGILTLDGKTNDELCLARVGKDNRPPLEVVTITPPTHYVTQDFGFGNLTVGKGEDVSGGYMEQWGNNVESLAYYQGSPASSTLLVVDKGGTLVSFTGGQTSVCQSAGVAEGRRVFFGARLFGDLIANGVRVFDRAFEWAAHLDAGAGAASSGWLESSTFDTGIMEGAAFNSIMWQGTSGTGGTNIVKFQLATANCSNGAINSPACTTSIGWGGSKASGDGAFLGPGGTSAESDKYFPSGPGVSAAIATTYHNNKRYFRYRVFLEKDAAATTPVVQDIIINWSP